MKLQTNIWAAQSYGAWVLGSTGAAAAIGDTLGEGDLPFPQDVSYGCHSAYISLCLPPSAPTLIYQYWEPLAG